MYVCACEDGGGVGEGRIKACNPTSFLIHMTTVAKSLMKNSGLGGNNDKDSPSGGGRGVETTLRATKIQSTI